MREILPMDEDILPPSDDYVFKAVMTHPDAKPALMDLISAVIGRKVSASPFATMNRQRKISAKKVSGLM